MFGYRGVQMRSNIIGMPNFSLNGKGGSIGAGPTQGVLQMTGSKYLSEYIRAMDQLEDYELSDLSKTILQTYSDFITGYFNEQASALVEFKDGHTDDALERVNQIMAYLKIQQDIKVNLKQYLYWGNHCSLLGWSSEEKKFYKKPLFKSNIVITIKEDQEVSKHLVVDEDGNLQEISPTALIRYGVADLSLINNIVEEAPNLNKETKEDKIVKRFEYLAASPLYYDLVPQVKEFLLIAQVVSLLNIKELVQPLLLLLNTDKNTDPSIANQMAINLENLINKYTDISAIFSSRFSINELKDALINNIRVYSDVNGVAGSMQTLDLSKLKEKADSLRSDQEVRKESIVNALGLTMDLIQGRSTRWDASRQSEKLNSKINSFVSDLNMSVLQIACQLYKLITGGKTLDISELKSNLFLKTATQIQAEIANTEVLSNLLNTLNQVLDSSVNMMRNNPLVDSTLCYKYVKAKLSAIDSEAADLLTEDKFLEFFKSLTEQSSNGY